MRRKAHAAAAMALAAVCLAACEPAPDESPAQRLIAAYQMGQEYEWDAARAYAKAYLQVFPEDASGHFLLGQSYLRIPVPNLTMAEGEIMTAIRLFDAHGQVGALEPVLAAPDFEFNLQLEAARTYVRAFREVLVQGFPVSQNLGLLEMARDHVDRGLALQPDHKYLKEMRAMLAGYLGEPKPLGVTI
ncbi:MAG: hypothetical protein HYV27_25080 [Candidatus Hydrogenedentes bacterium]|nr:hypothetical protein [Candidatus Hydrogenedentota bacterium]